jgi:NAD+ synthase (glutamine-hydrolysing)
VRLLHLGAAALNQTPMDWDGNRDRIRAAIADARSRGVQLLCLPELCVSGYGCEDAFHGPELARTAEEVLQELLPDTAGMAVCFGLPVFVRGSVYNAVALAVNGALIGLTAKRDLAGDGVHYEPRWFKAWPRDARGEVQLCGARVPIGDLIFELGDVRVGFEICEEAWVPDRTGVSLAARGADVVLNPSASHFAFGKAAVRDRFVLEGARAFGCAYVFANLVGNESGRLIFDGGCRIAAGGAMVARGPRLGFHDHHLIDAVVDLDAARTVRARTASSRAWPGADDAVRCPLDWSGVRLRVPTDPPPRWDEGPEGREEAFTRAIALGLHDYTRKSRSRGWVISLSGGADSAAVTVLCALSNQLAAAELGLDGLKARLGYIPMVRTATGLPEVQSAMITTLYQATRNSGPVTEGAAQRVADAVGARHLRWSVDAEVGTYTAKVEGALGRALTWATDDIALQNIQARVRSPGVWMLTNVEDKLLLSTSNRSEAAVGYATMDGDTSGGLSPIAGIDKAFLRVWLAWMQRQGPAEAGPLPALEVITAQQPTAELRPPAAGQTDEDDLMPYPILDAIERMAIRDKLGPLSCHQRLMGLHPEADPRLMARHVRRFFQLWSRNQWKRERYAPSFHVDDENLDPKTWCRFPILSGGFRRELALLDAAVADTAGP